MKELLEGKHFMVDFETTGLDPQLHSIIEFGCVEFDLKALRVVRDFCAIVVPMQTRAWNNETLKFHLNTPETTAHLASLIATAGALPAKTVFEHFVEWLGNDQQHNFFWCKPVPFDYAFFTSYLQELGMVNPFHYRNIVDLASFLRGMCYEPTGLKIQSEIKYPRKHTALQDARDQIEVLFNVIRHAHGL